MFFTRIGRLTVGEVVAGVVVGLVTLGLVLVGVGFSFVVGGAIVILLVLGARNRANDWGSLEDRRHDDEP